MRDEQDVGLPGWLRVTLGTVGDVVLFAALALVIWTVLPAVALGATPVIVSGGSMSPLIRAGDVVLLDDAKPPTGEMFAPNTVVTFEATDAAGTPTGELVTHRVTRASDGLYVTRGDANAGDDPRPVHPDQLVGAGRWLVPFVGLPAYWARSGAWYLVALSVLGAAAAVAASLAGRRRVAVEEVEELEEVEEPEDERIVEEPLVPALPAPVLALHPDPAAAERGAAVAAQAARRGLAGVDRVREEDGERRTTRRGNRAGGSSGSAPVASILAIALALLGSTVVPSFAAAAYVATTNNTDNSFATALAATGPSTYPLLHDAGGFVTGGNPHDPTDFPTITIVTQAPIVVDGAPWLTLHVTNTRGSTRTVEVVVRVDGHEHTGSATAAGEGPLTIVLAPALDRTIPAGTTIEVDITTAGVDIDVAGPSSISFPD